MMDNVKQVSENIYIEWQKRFVNGEQFTYVNSISDTIEDETIWYFWTSRRVFNLIKARVDQWVADYDEEYIWGQGKAVDQLIPYQQQYNLLMNQITEITRRIACPLLCVEDGSVDTAELCADGLGPGKVIVYRQGSNRPELLKDNASDVTALYAVAVGVKHELIQLMEDLEENFE